MSAAKKIKTARRLIAKHGESVIYTRVSEGGISADPTAGRAETTTDYPVTAFPYAYDQSEVNGTTVRQGDRLLVLVAEDLAVTPQSRDRVTVGGTAYDVVRVDSARE